MVCWPYYICMGDFDVLIFILQVESSHVFATSKSLELLYGTVKINSRERIITMCGAPSEARSSKPKKNQSREILTRYVFSSLLAHQLHLYKGFIGSSRQTRSIGITGVCV